MRSPYSQSSAKKTELSEKEVSELKNLGKLILDATCAPGHISYPTDIKLLITSIKRSNEK